MNNNQLNNTVFCGSTHLDNITALSNVLVKNIINTSNYILYSSNDLASNIRNTSNNLISNINNTSNYILYSSNQISNELKKFIYEKTETSALSIPINHTYIYNSNLSGEIRFWAKSTSLFPPQVPLGVPDYRVKIDVDGKLKLYYTYDSSISATWGNGWIDIANMLVGIIAGDTNVGITLGGLQAEILALAKKEENDIIGVYNALIALNNEDLNYDFDDLMTYRQNILNGLTEESTRGNMDAVYDNIRSGIQQRNFGYFNSALNNINLVISRNPITTFFLGIGGVAFSISYGLLQNMTFNNYLNSVNKDILANSNISFTSKRSLLEHNSNILMSSNLMDFCKGYYDLSFNQGFINSNILTTQIIPNISTNKINISGDIMNNSGNIYISPNNYYYGSGFYLSNIQLSTNSSFTSYSSNFLSKTGGSLYGGLAITTGNVAVPASGSFGGIGDRIVLYNGSTGVYPFSIGINTNSFWNSVPTSATFDWYINGTKNLSLSSGTLNVIGNLQENGNNLSSIYATNINLSSTITNFNNTLNLVYTNERQYPPKAYDTSSSTDTTTTFLNKTVYTETMTINSFVNGYMIGVYTIFSSSVYNASTLKNLLFNYNIVETVGAHWAPSQYTAGGLYNSTNYIISNYLGDWLILKLPNPIILTRFRFYSRVGFLIRAPAEWKCYGSIDGLTFTEITEGNNLSRLSVSDYSSGYYEKTLASTFTTPYLYLGWCVNKLAGSDSIMNFIELQIFGTELLNPIYNYISSNNLTNILTPYPNYSYTNNLTSNFISSNTIPNIVGYYISSNVLTQQYYTSSNNLFSITTNNMPYLNKKSSLSFTCSTSVVLVDNKTYYKYDIDLRLYTKILYTPNSSPYRIFTIRAFLTNCYFNLFYNNLPFVFNYEIYMCNELNAGTSPLGGGLPAGLNVCAIGYPENLTMNLIQPNGFFPLKTGDFNYISVIAPISGTLVSCIIEDLLY